MLLTLNTHFSVADIVVPDHVVVSNLVAACIARARDHHSTLIGLSPDQRGLQA